MIADDIRLSPVQAFIDQRAYLQAMLDGLKAGRQVNCTEKAHEVLQEAIAWRLKSLGMPLYHYDVVDDTFVPVSEHDFTAHNALREAYLSLLGGLHQLLAEDTDRRKASLHG
jgi:hypothetical protein